mmetsp:Transcript_42447/g.76486  ORF Transcript_42447/g.76486 Transcript_42447/m.76486 type:complete len:277 (+) Transcript_42447:1426-2256(+)
MSGGMMSTVGRGVWPAVMAAVTAIAVTSGGSMMGMASARMTTRRMTTRMDMMGRSSHVISSIGIQPLLPRKARSIQQTRHGIVQIIQTAKRSLRKARIKTARTASQVVIMGAVPSRSIIGMGKEIIVIVVMTIASWAIARRLGRGAPRCHRSISGRLRRCFGWGRMAAALGVLGVPSRTLGVRIPSIHSPSSPLGVMRVSRIRVSSMMASPMAASRRTSVIAAASRRFVVLVPGIVMRIAVPLLLVMVIVGIRPHYLRGSLASFMRIVNGGRSIPR